MISDTYRTLESWLDDNDLLDGYIFQIRRWYEMKNTEQSRFIVIIPSGGGANEEALTNDYFRVLVISKRNEIIINGVSGVDEVNDHADKIRQCMIDNYSKDCVIYINPIGGIQQNQSKEGRWIFEFTVQLKVSR